MLRAVRAETQSHEFAVGNLNISIAIIVLNELQTSLFDLIRQSCLMHHCRKPLRFICRIKFLPIKVMALTNFFEEV